MRASVDGGAQSIQGTVWQPVTRPAPHSDDLPPDVRAALRRIRDGAHVPADLDVLRRAVAAGQAPVVPGDRAAAIGGSANDAVIVIGDGDTIIKPRGQRLRSWRPYLRVRE